MVTIGFLLPLLLWPVVATIQLRSRGQISVAPGLQTVNLWLTIVGVALILYGKFYIETRVIAILLVIGNFFLLRAHIGNHAALLP